MINRLGLLLKYLGLTIILFSAYRVLRMRLGLTLSERSYLRPKWLLPIGLLMTVIGGVLSGDHFGPVRGLH
jgi:hypothetical protein